jgi:8-oxo-dGTP pyrophosphatase MutT (NUDIX family)
MDDHRNCAGFGLFKMINGTWHVLLVKTKAGHHSMPKGKRIRGETYLETAYRETFEETGIIRDMISMITYETRSDKGVKYFCGLFTGPDDFTPYPSNPNELEEARWYPVSDVQNIDMREDRKTIIMQFASAL